MYRYLEHIIKQVRGGSHYWSILSESLKNLTPEEQEALYRVLQNTRSEAEQEGKREGRKHLGIL